MIANLSFVSGLGSWLRRASAVLVLALAVVGCDQQSGITSPSERRASQSALGVELDGPFHVDYAGDYTYTAYASGGTGSYTYSWQVYRPQTGWTQMAETGSALTIYIGRGEGEAQVSVTVQSGSQTASGFKFTTNGIGCDGDYCPIEW